MQVTINARALLCSRLYTLLGDRSQSGRYSLRIVVTGLVLLSLCHYVRCSLLNLLLCLDFFRLFYEWRTTVARTVEVLLQLLLVQKEFLLFHVFLGSFWPRVEV